LGEGEDAVGSKKQSRKVDERLRDLQQEVLVAVASGTPLPSVMNLLCERAEALATNAVCSIIRVDAAGCLRPLAGPSLPQEYSDAIDGVAIGPMIGSCGSAAFHGEAVEVTSIKTDPRWREFKHAALALGLKACWSSPIKSHDGRVVGTFAFYFRTARRASKLEKRIVESCTHVCSLAIEHWEAHDHIRKLAFTDPLTGLGNRAYMAETFPEILARAKERDEPVAVLYVDIDGFRMLNEAQGHKNGDLLLCSVADRLRKFATSQDAVARLGSDEFLIVCAGRKQRVEIEAVATDLSNALAERHVLEPGLEVKAVASIGIACFPDNGHDLQSLLGHADTALRRVKASGLAGYTFYTAHMDAEKLAQRALERDVSTAAMTGQLSVVYQPQADAETGAIQGFEALLRWQHPIHGFVSPMVFIPAAEACGAIEDIGAFVLREALAQAATWPRHLRVAVNASPAQIVRSSFAKLVEDTLAATGVDPSRLEIEVTESLFIFDEQAALATLRRLKEIGVSVAIDDFGTGYSSLSTLRSFPFDRIKIDRSFIFDMIANGDAAAIVTSILGLGRALGRPVVAEGVETEEQLELLRSQGCNHVQGYLIGKPLPIESYASLISAKGKRRASSQYKRTVTLKRAAVVGPAVA
jgi:diguanylate cyclase (GGDEF)-like protein